MMRPPRPAEEREGMAERGESDSFVEGAEHREEHRRSLQEKYRRPSG